MAQEPEITIGQGKSLIHVKGNAIKQMDGPLRLLLFGHGMVQFCKGVALAGLPTGLDDRFHETGRHGTGDVFVDSPFGFD